jgi:hypothetical protein
VLLEFEDVSVIGEERYNSTVNGQVQYPTVTDPDGSEVNQIFLRYVGPAKAELRLGRQVLALDNTRFVCDVPWRQNQQTLDALTVEWKGVDHLQVLYSFVENVNRVFGQDSPQGDQRMASHLLNAGYDVEGWGRIVGYAYLLDYDTVDTLSSNTWGLRLTGHHPFGGLEVDGTLEAAKQMEAGDNSSEIDQDYLLGELGAKYRGFRLSVGQETLGGSGDPGDAFQTPLATLHSFNGWADKFLTTPDAGLVDFYVGATQVIDNVDLQVVWHAFQSDAGSQDYGQELDASLGWKIAKGLTFGLKLADYDAEDFASDTTKAWVWLAYAP